MNCKHSVIIDDGEHVCELCGTILARVIDEGAEWRNYDDSKGEDKSRGGFTTSDLLPNSSYGSVVSFRGISSTSTELKTIQRLSVWSMSSNSERSWIGIFDTIQTCCTNCGLPKSIIMDACGLYKQMEDAQKVRGETRRALMGGAVFVVCRNHGVPRSHEEIGNIFNTSIRQLCKAILKYSPVETSVLQTQIGIAERLCTSLSLNDQQRDEIFVLLQLISTKSEDEFEHTPKTIVAGVVAHIMGLKTKRQMKIVSDASGVSSLSIHKLVGKL
jgi:transcription initiation factor TFIIIB Brf1 subunit/transcription initiation factor TFIIB